MNEKLFIKSFETTGPSIPSIRFFKHRNYIPNFKKHHGPIMRFCLHSICRICRVPVNYYLVVTILIPCRRSSEVKSIVFLHLNLYFKVLLMIITMCGSAQYL